MALLAQIVTVRGLGDQLRISSELLPPARQVRCAAAVVVPAVERQDTDGEGSGELGVDVGTMNLILVSPLEGGVLS